MFPVLLPHAILPFNREPQIHIWGAACLKGGLAALHVFWCHVLGWTGVKEKANHTAIVKVDYFILYISKDAVHPL